MNKLVFYENRDLLENEIFLFKLLFHHTIQ